MANIDQICEEAACTGCGLCENICPMHAISMKKDEYFGHKRPTIDATVCVGCGLCVRKCPSNAPIPTNQIERVYAAWQLDDKKHDTSSSGGIAAALYERYLENGGWIVGVRAGKQLEPEFVLSNEYAQIAEFKGSKYVQPVIGTIYQDVLDKLKQGEQVIFIGLPCQCAAMKRGAEIARTNNLLVVDIVCHGVPSYHAFITHLKNIEGKTKKIAEQVNFRDKNAGECLSLNDKEGCFYKRNLHEDVFMHSFISGELFAESCYNCRYACAERVGDLTICDFWGLGVSIPFDHKVRRVSAVLINTEKGERSFELIRDMLYAEERPINEAVEGNDQLRMPSYKGVHRDELMAYMREGNFECGLHDIYGKSCNKKYYRRWVKERVKMAAKFLGVGKRKCNG